MSDGTFDNVLTIEAPDWSHGVTGVSLGRHTRRVDFG
jgi:hypothetical protein